MLQIRLLTLLEAEAKRHAPGLTACGKESRDLDPVSTLSCCEYVFCG